MSPLIQPLSEHFLYCSPETMNRELYRLHPAPSRRDGRKQKKTEGDRYGKSKNS